MRVGKLTLVLVLDDVLSDEAPLGVRPARVLYGRVHVDAEAVAYAPDLDVLIEAVVAAVLRQKADVALSERHLVVAGGVVGNVSVRDVLDVLDHAVEDLGDLDVRAVVRRDHFPRRTVLPLLVRDLPDVLRQLVDRQTRPRVDRLALHRPPRRQHVSRPLPLVVRRPGHEPQIVKFILARVGIGRQRLREPRPHGVQNGHLPLFFRCTA